MDENEFKAEYYSLSRRGNYFFFHMLDKGHSSDVPTSKISAHLSSALKCYLFQEAFSDSLLPS